MRDLFEFQEFIFHCPTGLSFNVERGLCDWGKGNGCYQKEAFGDVEVLEIEYDFQCKADGVFPYPDDCAKYYVCEDLKAR